VSTIEWSPEKLGLLVKECLAEGKPVEIDGLGAFLPDPGRGFRFVRANRPQIFLAYVMEDAALAGRLYDSLAAIGFNPWMDKRKLLPGQNWPRAIEDAIETSDFFVPCFSTRSVSKKGGFQAEIRYALDCARLIPLDDVFIVPVRLDACRIPACISRVIQYTDLFPDWERGMRRLTRIIHRQMALRAARG
jgi:hypothetical protein